MWKGAATILVTVAMAACGRSPLEPSSANHVEPPGVLGGPGAGGRSGARDHVEPPGVLREPGCGGNAAADEHVEPPGVLRDGSGGEPPPDPDPEPPCDPGDPGDDD